MDFRQGGEHEHAHGQLGDRFFESNSPHFFKIILHETIQNEKMRIPKKFARNYCGSDFLGKQHQMVMVSLKLPSGDVWDVEMKTCDDNQLCLHRGWPEFVDFYGIKHGHLLVFKYKRGGMFHVRIFDTSTAEIKYPMKSSSTNTYQECIHLLEDQSRRDIKPEMPNKSPNPQSPAQDHAVGTSSTENTVKIVDTSVESHSKNRTRTQMSKRSRESHESKGGTNTRTYKRRLIRVKRDRALERGTCFKSRKRNPCFSIVMCPSYLNYFTLDVPGGFFVEHLKLQNTTTVELCTSARRSWTMKYNIYYLYNNKRKCKLTAGWRGFVKDNKLVEGDVCVFELIKRNPIVFHVTISRAPEDPTFACRSGFGGSNPQKSIQCPNSHKLRDDCVMRKTYKTPLGQSEKKRSAPQLRGSSFNPTNPSFSIVMQPTYAHKGFLNVPRNMGQLGPKSGSMVKLSTSDGRSWTAKYYCTVRHNQPYCRLRSGWRKFVKDNNLVEGDICVFKLIKSAPTLVVFHVTVCKDAAFHKNIQGKRKREDQILCSRPAKNMEPASASASASASTTASNCLSKFWTVMTQRYLCGSNLTIPRRVARRMFMFSKETVAKNIKLEIGDRTWSMKAFYYPVYGIGKISAGWTNFVKENYLEVGDICSFELVDSKELVSRVSIRRAIN